MSTHITFSVESGLLEQALSKAAHSGTTLDELFHDWLTRYLAESTAAEQFDALMQRLKHIGSGGQFSRDEMNMRA